MRYNTIVDKSEGGLEEIISAVEQFEEDRLLAGLQVRRHTMYDIQQASLMVREYQQKMNREVLALSRFSETFIQKYATDNNECALPLAHEFADHNTLGIVSVWR